MGRILTDSRLSQANINDVQNLFDIDLSFRNAAMRYPLKICWRQAVLTFLCSLFLRNLMRTTVCVNVNPNDMDGRIPLKMIEYDKPIAGGCAMSNGVLYVVLYAQV